MFLGSFVSHDACNEYSYSWLQLLGISFFLKNIIIIMMIVMALIGIIQDVCNLLTGLQTVSDMYAQVAWVLSCTNHMQDLKR